MVTSSNTAGLDQASSPQTDQGPSSPRASDDDCVSPGSRRSRSLSGDLPGHTGTAVVTQP